MLAGGVVAAGLWRWRSLIPTVPEGDILILMKGPASAGSRLSASMERIEERLRQWPVVGVLLLTLTMVLVATMLVGR